MSGHKRIRTWSAAGVVCIGLTTLAGQATAAQAAAGRIPSASTGWRVVARIPTITVYSVVAPSRSNAWVLGNGYTVAQPQAGSPSGLHWNGRSWSTVAFPKAISTTGIACAAATSPSDVWAFAGTDNTGAGALAAGALRLEGGRWKLVKLFPAATVSGCLVESPTDVWVFGEDFEAGGVGTWHLSGHTWRRMPFGSYAIADASAASSDDIWGEGLDQSIKPAVAHWNGRKWVRNTQLARALPSSSADALFPRGITALGPHNVWFRVVVERNHAARTIVLHWNGRRWLKVGPASFGYYLPGAVPDGHGGWWTSVIVGTPGHQRSRVLHAVRGRWLQVPLSIKDCPTGIVTGLAPVVGTTSVLGAQDCASMSRPFVNVLLHGPKL